MTKRKSNATGKWAIALQALADMEKKSKGARQEGP
jgi:hypothetical protein